MKKILLFLLDGYADWESGFVSAKLNKPELGFEVETISLKTKTVTSQGNFVTNVAHTLESFDDFDNLSALVLIGGTGWGNQHLIKGYHPNRYDESSSANITALIDECLIRRHIIVAGICDGATFLADNGYLNKIDHTGNSLQHLQDKALDYAGAVHFKERQAVSFGKIITANGTAPLEFTRELLLGLEMLEGQNQVDEWYQTYKQGVFHYDLS